jgi:5'-3' exonuclease
VEKKFGVRPESIPDWLALVGDTADGYPGIDGWGEKSASIVLSRYKHLEAIPRDYRDWEVKVNRAQYLSGNLERHRKDAGLFRRLATLREDVPLKEDLGDLEWRGARRNLKVLCRNLGEEDLTSRITTWRTD